jgi:hypothetical protein
VAIKLTLNKSHTWKAPGNITCGIRAETIDDHNIICPWEALESPGNVWLLVKGENDWGDML